MNIIGVSGDCRHNSSVALIQNGELVYAEAEERISRIKGDGNFPTRALAEAIAQVGDKQCLLVGAGQPDNPDSRRFVNAMVHAAEQSSCKLHWVEHHQAHARCAAYTMGGDDGAILTADGQGDGTTMAYWQLSDNQLKKIWSATLDDGSLGFFFAAITEYLGYKRLHDEGKICALAASGSANPQLNAIMESVIQLDRASDGSPCLRIDPESIGPWHANQPIIREAFACHLEVFKPADIALAAQLVVENILLSLLNLLRDQFSSDRLALAGGLFANVRINWRLSQLPWVKKVSVTPPMGDDGLAIGAAVETALSLDQIISPSNMMYLGTNSGTIPKQLHPDFEQYSGLPEEINQIVARLLANGEVVVRSTGRGEFGPRALGNRSLLYRPNDLTAGNWLNGKLGRDSVMPFAPCVQSERINTVTPANPDTFDGLRHMTVAVPVTDAFRTRCPGVVHLDNTARVQAVYKDSSPQLWQILEYYQRLTGLPALINTSLNRHREPICRTLDDALDCAEKANFNFVLAGPNHLFYRKSRHPLEGL